MNSSRIYGLDVLRALAIILVVISHSKPLIFSFISKEYEKYLMHLGLFGVEIFFVLSGFLIGSILINEIFHKDITKKSIYNFWIKRWFRTLPLYLFFLIVNIIMYIYFIQGKSQINFFYFFVFLQNFSTPHPPFMLEAWSLAVEEWFYIITPVTLFSSVTIFKKYFSIERITIITIISLLILITINRYLYVYNNNPEFGETIRKLVVFRLDALLYGVLLAYIFKMYKDFLFKYKNVFFIIGLSIFLYFYIALIIGIPLTLFIKTFFFTFVDLAFALIIAKFYFIKKENNSISVLSFISMISYSIYLSHLLILEGLQRYLHVSNAISSFNKFIIFITLVLLISTITYYLIEKPFMKMRNRFIVP